MEVTPASGPCGCHYRGRHEAETLQRLLTPETHYTPHLQLSPRSLSSKSPQRDFTATPFCRSKELGRRDTPCRTLEGVLRGQVPSLFTDLCRSSRRSDNGRDVVSRCQQGTPSTAGPPRTGPISTPRPSPSFTGTTYSLKRSYTEVEQQEPIDLSCKKMRGDLNRTSGQMDLSTMESCIDNSAYLHGHHSRSPSPPDAQGSSAPRGSSLLRNLLCLGKDLDPSHCDVTTDTFMRQLNGRFSFPEERPVSSGPVPHPNTHIRDSHNRHIDNQSVLFNGCNKNNSTGGLTKVTLAKKNMLPVSARVSDWLVKIIRFAKSIPEFSSMLHNDKLALVLNSWARLLLLYMAENNFQFAVTPDFNADHSLSDGQCPENSSNQEEPTMKSVESVQTFIRKCQNMGTDSKEYAFLRMAVLFNAGIRGLDRPDMVDRVNSSVQQLLQQHVQAARPRDFMHYSRLLMSLPALYGINCKMIENLFCRHINGNMDMDVLLKEMLQNI